MGLIGRASVGRAWLSLWESWRRKPPERAECDDNPSGFTAFTHLPLHKGGVGLAKPLVLRLS